MVRILNKSGAASVIFFINSYFHQMYHRNPVSKSDSKLKVLQCNTAQEKQGKIQFMLPFQRRVAFFPK